MKLIARAEQWPLAEVFTISRGSRTETELVAIELADGEFIGHGECMANPRYGETQEDVLATLGGLDLASGLDRDSLQALLPATAFTLSLATPEKMGASAKRHADRPLLKLKVTGEGDFERVAAVREGAPNARLIVDANEGWTADMVEPLSDELKTLGVEMIEQPLPAAKDAVLADLSHPVPLCADESCHTSADLAQLKGRYEIVNIKLDKTGGFTEALKLKQEAYDLGFQVMVGCMVATSLAMAPAHLVAQGVAYVDIDGPLLLARDRQPGLFYEGSSVGPPDAALWG